MVSKKELKKQNKRLKKQLSKMGEELALVTSNFHDLISYTRTISIFDLGKSTIDIKNGTNQKVFGPTSGGKSPLQMESGYGARTGRMYINSPTVEDMTHELSRGIARAKLVQSLLKMPNVVPNMELNDGWVTLLEPFFNSIVKQVEEQALLILDNHLDRHKIIDFDNIPKEVLNYIHIVRNEQLGKVKPNTSVGAFLLSDAPNGQSLKNLSKGIGSPSIEDLFPPEHTPTMKECNEQLMQESNGMKYSQTTDCSCVSIEASAKIHNERKPNQQKPQQGDTNLPCVVGSVLFEEEGNPFACEVPVYSTSLKNILTDAGIFISPKEYTPIVFDYLHSLDSSKPADKITLKEKKHHMRVLVDKIAKQSKVKTETNIFNDVLLERGLLISSEGDTSVVTIAKSKPSFTPFQV